MRKSRHVTLSTTLVLLIAAAPAWAQQEKVPEKVLESVVEAEKKSDAQEKTEIGEASGNISDCEPVSEGSSSSQAVDEKDLDECTPLVK